MTQPMAPSIVGREAELAAVSALLDDHGDRPTALVLDGEAGIGKTTVWLAGVGQARELGYRVIVCRPAETEASLPFVSLSDLIEPVLESAAGRDLGAPQRGALETALGRIAPTEGLGQLAVSRAALALIRALAAEGRVLVAIDDVQWLDPATTAVLAFVARRLAGLPVRLLIARRTDREAVAPLGLGRALPPEALRIVRVGPLAPGDLDRVIRASLEFQLPRPRLLELHRISGGNPFYALEIARAVGRQDMLLAGEPLSLPPTLSDLVRDRLAALSVAAQTAVLLAAAASQPTSDLVERAAGTPEGLADAFRDHVLELDGPRLRFTHPLLASVSYGSARPWERREAHRQLARIATDAEERARHLALSTEDADEGVAAELERAAGLAAARGAPESAAQLAEHAARLTPRGQEARRRLADAAEHHTAAGDPARGRAILEGLIDRVRPGPERADLLWRLADAVGDDLGESIRLCLQALDETGDDPALGARIHTALGIFTWIAGDLARSAEHSRAAARLGEAAGDKPLVAMALGEVCHAETVLGLGFRSEDMAQALELEREIDTFPTFLRPSFQLGVISLYTDDLERARPLLSAELERVVATGDESAHPGVLFRLAELELRAGNWGEAARLARESVTLVLQAGIEQEQGALLMGQALVQAHLGNTTEARAAGEAALDIAERSGDRVVAIRSLGALGFLELSRGEPEAALERLTPARQELESLGVGELSISQVVQNEIEALVAVGRLEEAEHTIAFVEEKGRPTGRAWHEAIARRGRALVAAARGDVDRAREHVEGALTAHRRLPQPFELGRTLLVQGSIERRAKRRGEAREAITAALDVFDRLGAPLWAERAAAELARIPGRRPSSSEMTETEQQVAELVADGLSNKEVAARLFITVRTVEANLTRVYAKLGVRSRTELVTRLGRR